MLTMRRPSIVVVRIFEPFFRKIHTDGSTPGLYEPVKHGSRLATTAAEICDTHARLYLCPESLLLHNRRVCLCFQPDTFLFALH
jgi:hypothetical protein